MAVPAARQRPAASARDIQVIVVSFDRGRCLSRTGEGRRRPNPSPTRDAAARNPRRVSSRWRTAPGFPANGVRGPTMYRALNSERIVAILETLQRRIVERFPDASLAKVCAELVAIGRETGGRTARIAMPDYTLRTGIAAAIIGGLVLLAYAGAQVEVKREGTNVYGILQGVESGFNIVALMGAAIFFLVTFEVRWKRRRAMAGLHELRS